MKIDYDLSPIIKSNQNSQSRLSNLILIEHESEIMESVFREYQMTGRIDLRNRLVAHYKPIAEMLAFVYARKLSRIPEMKAEAYLALIELIDQACVNVNNGKVEPYIRRGLRHRLVRFNAHDHVIPVHETTKPDYIITSDYETATVDHDMLSFRETLAKLELTPLEEQIIVLRIQDHRPVEICEKLRINQCKYFRTLKTLRKKYTVRISKMD